MAVVFVLVRESLLLLVQNKVQNKNKEKKQKKKKKNPNQSIFHPCTSVGRRFTLNHRPQLCACPCPH
jgi:hypothetical protein